MPFFHSEVRINGACIGQNQPVYCIAEAGVAHFGSLEKALRLVDMAAQAQADAVKFQMFDVDDLICGASDDWKRRLRSRQLPKEDFRTISQYCADCGITFLCTAHDLPSLEFLDTQLHVPAFKVGSGEVDNEPFLENIACRGKPVILSTGMHTCDNIQRVIDIFTACKNSSLILLHCVTAYPAPLEQVNLHAIQTLHDKFHVLTGYSDHTVGFHIPLAAAALGAVVIEKHITIDFDVPDAQDWKVSCGPENLSAFISQLRGTTLALGDGKKTVAAAECSSLLWARKSIVAARDIAAGEPLDGSMLTFKRPGTGLAPSALPQVLGKKLRMPLKFDEILHIEDLYD